MTLYGIGLFTTLLVIGVLISIPVLLILLWMCLAGSGNQWK